MRATRKVLALAAWPVTDKIQQDPEHPFKGLKQGLGPAGYEALTKRLGEEPIDYLGSGFTGSAFLLPSGKVLKLTTNAELLAAIRLQKAGEHPNVATIHDAFAILQKDSQDRIFGVAVVVKDAVDGDIMSLGDPRLAEAAQKLIGWWEPALPTGGRPRLQFDCESLQRWIDESAKLDLDDYEQVLRQDLVDGIDFLAANGLCPGDLLDFTNVGVKDGRAVFFDIMNQAMATILEGDVPSVWGLK